MHLMNEAFLFQPYNEIGRPKECRGNEKFGLI